VPWRDLVRVASAGRVRRCNAIDRIRVVVSRGIRLDVSSIELILARLNHVRSTGAGRWLARCPAHEDGRPSLSLRELDDGRVLLHCFAGCSTGDVLAAIALDFNDLFPAGAIRDHCPRERRAFAAGDVLRALSEESIVLVMMARRVAESSGLSAEDRERLLLAASRINAAADMYA
jgi:hypothetical protein